MRFCWPNGLFIIAILVAAFSAPPSALASVTVDGVEFVERTRVGRTIFNYTYRVTATNNAPVTVEAAVAYLSLSVNKQAPSDLTSDLVMLPGSPVAAEYGNLEGGGTVLIDADVPLGDIAAGATVTSTDTFTLQQDRRFPFNMGALIWEVGYTASVTLSGLVTDQPIPAAELELIVDRSESGRPIIESGRPIIESYSTTADAQGRYTIDVDFVADTDFVTITADGVTIFDFVELHSIVGSAGSLLEQASDGPLQVDSAVANPLNVTHVSTALATLAVAANGGQGFSNDTDLAAAQALVDTEELLISAAVIKTVIDNADINLPPGIGTTQDLLNNSAAFDEFLVLLQDNFPVELQTAIDETIIDLSVGYVAADVPPMLYLAFGGQNPFLNAGMVFTFDQNGTATHIGAAGETTDANWQVNASGHIVVGLNNSPQIESFIIREVPPGSGNAQQVRALQSTAELQIARIATGVAIDQVLLGFTSLTTFPDHVGVLPDEIVVTEPKANSGFLAFAANGIQAISSDDLVGEEIALTYYHRDNDSVGQGDLAAGADFLSFSANGTGSSARRQFTFSWAIDPVGRLFVIFSNGDVNQYVRYANVAEDGVSLGVLIARYGAGAVTARHVIGVSRTAGTQFSEATVLNRKFRSASALLNVDEASFPRFDFNFLPGNIGCRDTGGLQSFTWSISPESFVEQTRTFSPTFIDFTTWQAVAAVPGILGPRYWVLRTIEFGNPASPGFPSDPTATPGRLEFYEDIKDISGNTPPAIVDDSVSTTTDTPIFIDALANDIDTDDDDLIILGFGATTMGGTVQFAFDTSGFVITGFDYTPPAGASGLTDTFTYTLTDSSCAASPDTGTVNVTIN